MAEICTVSEEIFGSVKKVIWTWSTTGATTGITKATTHPYNAAVKRLVTVPGSSCSANWDVVVQDQDSTDVLMGGGMNRHSANTEQVNAASLGVIANDTMTMVITNVGTSADGVTYLYLR